MLLVNPQVITETEIVSMAKAACHEIDHIYLHWTAGHYGQAYDDYHLNIDRDGTVTERPIPGNGTVAASASPWTAGTGLPWRCL